VSRRGKGIKSQKHLTARVGGGANDTQHKGDDSNISPSGKNMKADSPPVARRGMDGADVELWKL